MKPHRDAAALAASLSKAATAPLPLPAMPPEATPLPANTSIGPEENAPEEKKIVAVTPPKKMSRQKIMLDTVQVTLRPRRELLERYVIAAADRTRDEKKPISPQQIMLEVLEKGLRSKL
jgi:hypothetical protein